MEIRFRRLLAGAAVIATLASLTVGVWPSQAKHAAEAADPTPELGELIAGTHQYVNGTHVWTDYAYDDRGPNTNGLAGGDATYPAGPGNEADLIQLQLGTDNQGRVTVAALLETLRDDSDAVVGVGLDVDPDADPQTGAVSVEGGQWKNADSLGLEYLAVVPTTGTAQLREWDSADGAWKASDLALIDVAVNPDTNVVSATLPVEPGEDAWEAVGVVGVLEADGSWFTGAQPIHDLAYVRGEDPTNEVVMALREQVPQLGFTPYQDKNQADVLSGYLPASRGARKVTFGTKHNEPPQLDEGFNAFLYHATIEVPEGVQPNPLRYDGPYMPYAVWVPGNALPVNKNEPTPLLIFLHGANQYQNVNLVHFNNPQATGLPSPYDVPAVVIFPNGRTTSWGTPLADRDALDAMEDALSRTRLNLDRERVVVSGVSSGGIGTFAMVSRYPDKFTGGYSLVGHGRGTAVENMTNVPFRASNGLLDPLINARDWRDSADLLNAAGTVDYRIVLVHNRSHDGPLPEGNCYYLDLLSRKRVTSPARVRYTTLALEPPARLERETLGVFPTSAYWVQGIDTRVDTASANVDLESLQLVPREVEEANIREMKENAVTEQDFCGPHKEFRKGSHWSTEGRSFKAGVRSHPSNALQGSLVNVAALTVDVRRAGLAHNEPIDTSGITTDDETVLTLVDPKTGWKDVRTLS